MITSLANEKIKEVAKLLEKKYRDKTSTFLVEGFHLVEEAKNANLLLEVFTSDESVEGTLVSRDVIKKLSSTETPQPVVGIVKKPSVKELGNKVLVLDNVQDPGNVGTLIRTAIAFGFNSIIIKGVDVFSPKVIRASQGGIFKLNIIQTDDVKSFFAINDHKVIGALLDKDAKTYNEIEVPKKLMLVLGNEGQGISKEVISELEEKVYIPISFESLNVAVAGGILMNEYSK